MRLLQVIAELNRGGAERIVIQLSEDALQRGDSVHVASGGGIWVTDVETCGARHHVIDLGSRSRLRTARAVWSLAAVLRRERFDVVHAHNIRATAAARAAMRLARRRVPLLTTVHGLAHADYAKAARVLRRSADHIVACAPAVARSLEQAGLRSANIQSITNGAALAPATPDRIAAVRASLGLDSRPLVVGIGRLVEQKAWTTLVDAAALIAEPQIVVAGEGPLRDELDARSMASGGRTRFVGGVDDVAGLLGQATCVVSTSEWEGLPLALLEALSLGVPAVATAVDGVLDVVTEPEVLLVAPGDPAATAAAVGRILNDPSLAARLAVAGKAASSRWAPERMLQEYRVAYERLAAAPRGV
jgi:glycosyltransferase involved in cell wall biosynthesis